MSYVIATATKAATCGFRTTQLPQPSHTTPTPTHPHPHPHAHTLLLSRTTASPHAHHCCSTGTKARTTARTTPHRLCGLTVRALRQTLSAPLCSFAPFLILASQAWQLVVHLHACL